MTRSLRAVPAAPLLDLEALLDSWEIALRAQRRSIETIESYTFGVRRFLAWCESESRAAVLDRALVSAFIKSLFDVGLAPATARARLSALRRFSSWLVDEGELASDALLGVRAPKLDAKVVESLSEAQLSALLAACPGTTQFRDRRDEAIVRFMAETGARAGEVVALNVDDVDLKEFTAVVIRGKGGKGRIVPFGPKTARAIDRYLRMRRSHRLASTPSLWLGDRGQTFGYHGLRQMLNDRADVAGIANIHPHQLRHTFANRWLAAGGSEDGLMTVAGWSDHENLRRYSRHRAADRAAAEARRLNLGDL